MYKMRITNKLTGVFEIVLIESPNQRDAHKHGILDSIMVMSGSVAAENCNSEIVDFTTNENKIGQWLEKYR